MTVRRRAARGAVHRRGRCLRYAQQEQRYDGDQERSRVDLRDHRAAGDGEQPGADQRRDQLESLVEGLLRPVGLGEQVRRYQGGHQRALRRADHRPGHPVQEDHRIISRTSMLSQRGWAAAIGRLTPDVRWLGDGRLQFNVPDGRPLDLGHAELVFIPSSLRTWRVAWEFRARFAVIYPAAGMLASPAARTAPEPLRRLLGPTRAEILLLLGEPITTTQLAAVTGLALGTIGSHLRILLDAGLAERHRSGASVLHRRTPTGQQLLGHPDPAGSASQPARPADLAGSGPSSQGVTSQAAQHRFGGGVRIAARRFLEEASRSADPGNQRPSR
jgi:DNA-binding transcriptional ArsR family regulator